MRGLFRPDPRWWLVYEHNRLHTRNVEALAATQVFAHHEVILAQHVGPRFGEARAIALICSSGKLSLLGAYQPVHFILVRLVAMRAVQVRGLLLRTLVEKISFFHKSCEVYCDYCTPICQMWRERPLQLHSNQYGEKKEAEAASSGENGESVGPRTHRRATRGTRGA